MKLELPASVEFLLPLDVVVIDDPCVVGGAVDAGGGEGMLWYGVLAGRTAIAANWAPWLVKRRAICPVLRSHCLRQYEGGILVRRR